MNIYLVVTELFKSYGGIQQFNKSIISGLYRINNNINLSVFSLNDSNYADNSIPSVHAKYYFSDKNKFRLILGLIKFLLKKPDIIIFSHVNFALLALLVPVLSPKTRIVFIIYGYEAWKKISIIKDWCLRRAELIISISHFTKNQFLEHNSLSEDKIKILHLSLDPYWQDHIKESLSDQRICVSSPYILTVSRLSTLDGVYKGVDTLIQSMALLRSDERFNEWKLCIVGEGDDSSRLIELSEALEVKDRVIFKGRVTKEELYTLYSHSEIFALPSKGEGFGLVYLEAMAYSKPVIAGDFGACGEIVIDGETGYLVRHGDTVQLKDTLSTLMISQELRKKLGINGKNRVEEYFTFPHFVERLNNILVSLS